MRSVSIASDGSCLVAGNHKVRLPSALETDLRALIVSLALHRRESSTSGPFSRGSPLLICSPRPNFKLIRAISSRSFSPPIPSKSPESPPMTRSHRLTLSCVSCRHLATCSADTSVKIWSTSSSTPTRGPHGAASPAEGAFKLEKVLQGHQRWVWDMAYSADSAYLVSGWSLPSSIASTFAP